jgi:hypothetical protein
MFYRIVTAPPGYPPHQKYMVRGNPTLELRTDGKWLKSTDGTIFFETIDEARQVLPANSRLLDHQPENPMFVELYESPS